MNASYEDLTATALEPLGFDDPAQACHILREMAGHDVPDSVFEGLLHVIIPALVACADPDRAVANLGRWADAVPNRVSAYGLLTGNSVAARMFMTVIAASQFFADVLIQTPEYLEVLLNPTIRDRGRSLSQFQADLARRVSPALTFNAKRDALRRFKPPEILRIGVRDLLGYSTMPETAREISDFADSCVQMALQICLEERHLQKFPFAVIAMGKLGGQELNYASDVDLIFVHGEDEDLRTAIGLGEGVRDTLDKTTNAGFVFRVDLRLRPEGRFGPISRSLEACRAYYESWAEPWERQALLKARVCAGDEILGAEFIAMADAFVYRPRVDEKFVQSIQANKRRMEQKVALAGGANTNVKEGIGGIRDIEFTVQLLQLIAGGQHPELRTGNTLEALSRLTAQDLLTESEQDTLADEYQFLRTVEHRLQILDERPVRDLPNDTGALRKFGRRLGYPNGVAFRRDYDQRTARVHQLFQRLFYGEAEMNLISESEPVGGMSLLEILNAEGFADPDAALALVERGMVGSNYGGVSPEARDGFVELLPALLEACGGTDNPDAALRGFTSLADSVPSRAALFRSFQDSIALLPRLCQLAANSPPLWQSLLAHPEHLDLLGDDEAMDQPPGFSETAKDKEALAAGLRRSRLKTGARDLWGLADTMRVMAEVSDTADWALQSAFNIARREASFTGRLAIIGLGKLGGAELGYASDLDVLFVGDSDELSNAALIAERVQRILDSEIGVYGQRWEVDARLRPDGRQGALVLDIPSYRRYYETKAATWERHALLKARFVAGNLILGQEFLVLTNEFVYERPWTETETEAVRAMKRRIENERLKDPHDVKLAPGGLADIEWTAQILQLQHGGPRHRLRVSGTLPALRALRDDVRITQAEWEVLSDTYLVLTRLRNHLYLKSGVSSNIAPDLPNNLAEQMQQVREIVLNRLFGEQMVAF
jgi:glutamate-ammonia-ligase adenylyltransferase